MQHPGGAALQLHLDHLWHRPPEILAAGGWPAIGKLHHESGGDNGVNRDDLAQGVSNGATASLPSRVMCLGFIMMLFSVWQGLMRTARRPACAGRLLLVWLALSDHVPPPGS